MRRRELRKPGSTRTDEFSEILGREDDIQLHQNHKQHMNLMKCWQNLTKLLELFYPTKNAQREMYSRFRTTQPYQSQDQE